MKGINNILEEERKAIVKLSQTIKNIEILNRDENMLTKINEVSQAITTMGNYLKYYYKHQLSLDDPCLDHCVRYSTSSTEEIDGETPFRSLCQHDHSSERCRHCNMLPNIIKEMEFLIKHVKKQATNVQYQEMLYEVAISKRQIEAYMHHLKRNHVQAADHDALFQAMDKGIIVLTIDWAMKLLGR